MVEKEAVSVSTAGRKCDWKKQCEQLERTYE
jgi:hypothetical protein